MAEFGKLNFSVSFNPTSAFPLDARSYFETLTEAQAAAATAGEAGSSTTTYYYGQTLVVVESGVATLYVIQPDKTLKAAGSAVLGDGKSISIVDGTVSLVGFDAAETGAQPRKKSDGTIEWIKPDTTTVEGLQTAVEGLESDVESLQTAVDTLTGTGEGSVDKKVSDAVAAIVSGAPEAYDTLKEMSDWISSHSESAAAMNSAIQQNAADILNKVDKVEGSRLMTEAEGTKLAGIETGAQVNAIDGVAEGELVISPDGKVLSIVAVAQTKVTGLTDALAGKVDAEEGKGLSENDYTTAEKEKLAGIAAGADANVLEVIKINGTALQISEKAADIPIATAEALGVVKSSTAENKVTVESDGTMTVNTLNISKLVQTDGDLLVLDGGNASGLAAVV